jgi:hypothetical protein
MTSLPAISPGEPICNLGELPKNYKASELRMLRKEENGLELRVKEDLASNILFTNPSHD